MQSDAYLPRYAIRGACSNDNRRLLNGWRS